MHRSISATATSPAESAVAGEMADEMSGPPAPPAHQPHHSDSRLIAGRFRLLEPLGRGGMGRVFRAQDELLGRLVAVKLIYDDAIIDSDVRHACALEARAAARLNHPGIVRILDSGFDDGHLYVVMSLAEGRTLSEIIRSDGPLPIMRALELAAQVADALEAAHQEGIIHCDVKPGNLIVRPDGTVQLVDFGIARIAASTTSLDSATLQGSAEYVAPEQVEGTDVDGRTDLYALGVVLFESLAGRTPFGGGTIASVLARRLVNDPPSVREFRADAPLAVEQLVRRMLARDPADRYQTAAKLRDALLTARSAALVATLPAPPTLSLTATAPLSAARAAALRARADRARAAADHQRVRAAAAGRRTAEAGQQAVALLAAGVLAAMRRGQVFWAWAGPGARAPFDGLSAYVRRLLAAGVGSSVQAPASRALRRPSLASSFGVAIVVGLLLGAAAAQCNVVGAATTTALTPDTASVATVDGAAPTPPRPAEAAPAPATVSQPAPTSPPPTATSAPPTPTLPPSTPTHTAPTLTSEPASAPVQAEEARRQESTTTAPAVPAPAQPEPPQPEPPSRATGPADSPPPQSLLAAPAAKPEGRQAQERQSDDKQRDEERRNEEPKAQEKKPEVRKPEVRKPEASGPPSRGAGGRENGPAAKPGNGPQKKR